jgi:hypothetical protein
MAPSRRFDLEDGIETRSRHGLLAGGCRALPGSRIAVREEAVIAANAHRS